MMERLVYTNEHGAAVEFSPRSVYHTNMKDVLGLRDVRNQIFSVHGMGQDGESFIGSRIERREVEITGHIVPRSAGAPLSKKEQVRQAQRDFAAVLNPQADAQLMYEFGSFRRVIPCRAYSAPTYTPHDVLERFTVLLVCPQPFWREAAPRRNEIAAWRGGLEFCATDAPAHSGLQLTRDAAAQPLWQIGWREPALIVTITNGGDVRTGMRIEFRAASTVERPRLLNMITEEFLQINTTLVRGDALVVTTEYGNKAVTLVRGGQHTNVFRYLDAHSTFLQLDVGTNTFRYSAAQNVDGLVVTIYHHNLFLGV